MIAEYYPYIYYNIILIFVLSACYRLIIPNASKNEQTNERTKSLFINKTLILIIFLILFIGLRPINDVFTDMNTYKDIFNNIKNTSLNLETNLFHDIGFHYFTLFCTKYLSLELFFFILSTIYILCYHSACKRLFRSNVNIAFLTCLGTISFFAYATNTIRSGVAAAFFLLGLSHLIDNKKLAITLIILSISFHKAFLLPAICLIGVSYYTNTRVFTIIWSFCIIFSASLGNYWTKTVSSIGFLTDDRMGYLTTYQDPTLFSRIGFRWDFIIYSAIPIIIGYYIIVIKKISNIEYRLFVNLYLLVNSFWILIIQANYSDRFAYLSWFLYPIVIIYPWLNFTELTNKKIWIINILVINILFAYTLFLLK